MTESFLTRHLTEKIQEVGPISFAEFMEVALYEPDHGYYQRAKKRVGRGPGTDFTTSSALGRSFVHLLGTAISDLLPEAPEKYHLVEIGAEEGGLPWEEGSVCWGGITRLGVNDPIELEGQLIVFSNELFDAQPFHRLVFRQGEWWEAKVGLGSEAMSFGEVWQRPAGAWWEEWSPTLPAQSIEGYRLDLPTGASQLLRSILKSSWNGLFLMIDYGKTKDILYHETPAGTMRAYRRHQQEKNLLADPGEIDLTGHVCWDVLQEILVEHQFAVNAPLRQESFFVRHAASMIQQLMENPAAYGVDPERRQLQALLHPGHLGSAFQVLSAYRGVV